MGTSIARNDIAVIAFLAGLANAITTAGASATVGAEILVPLVPIIAFLAFLDMAIATASQAAGTRTGIRFDAVAVVAFLVGVDESVATDPRMTGARIAMVALQLTIHDELAVSVRKAAE